MSNDSQPPKQTSADSAHAIVRSALGAIPGAGNAITELFNRIVTPPIEKRRDEWRQDIGERLQALEDTKSISASKLSENEAFISTLFQASSIAIRNHENEKLESLKNAVVNTALIDSPDEAILQMFLQFIDILTVLHVRILRFFQNPTRWLEAIGQEPTDFNHSSLKEILFQTFPRLNENNALVKLVLSDLTQRELLTNDSVLSIESNIGALNQRTTQFGDEFLTYITEGDNEIN